MVNAEPHAVDTTIPGEAPPLLAAFLSAVRCLQAYSSAFASAGPRRGGFRSICVHGKSTSKTT